MMKSYTLKNFRLSNVLPGLLSEKTTGWKSKICSMAFALIYPLLNFATISSTAKMDFNATPIAAGNYIWFTAVVDLSKVNNFPATIAFTEQSISCSAFTIFPPDASVTLNSASSATVTYSNGTLITIVPQNLAGIYFLSACMYQVPAGGLPGSLQNVTWTGLFSISKPGIVIDWRWAAAVYTNFSTDYNDLGIKPVDAATGSIYLNNDKSGTPENYKAFVTAGAKGGGGTNYVGGYTSWPPTIRTIINLPNVQLNHTDALCYGSNTATVTPSMVGGTQPFSYSWSNSSTGSDLTNVPAGSYSLTITDFVGLKDSAFVYVDEPPDIIAQITSQTNVSCNGGNNGTATVSSTGGTGNFSYQWSTTPLKTTASATGLAAGTYTVSVTDSLGCLETASVTIQQPATLVADILSKTNVSCFGFTDGYASLIINGGTSPYSFSWNTSPVKTTSAVNGIAAGTYNVTVTDFKGCADTSTVTITQPDTLLASAFADTVAGGYNVSGCGINDGAIDLSVTGGTPPYIYQWNNGSTTEDLNSVGPGDYNVMVLDGNGCSAEASRELTQPGFFEATSVISPVVNGGYNIGCKGQTNGIIDVTLAGGAAPFSYLWSNGETTEDLVNVGAGIYSLTVTDGNGCTTISSSIVTEPDSLFPVASIAEVFGGYNISCNGSSDGAIDLSVAGGTSPFSFQWSNGDTTEDISNLPAGVYSVTITDDNGCSNSFSDTLTEPVSFNSGANAATVTGGNNISCFGASNGSIDLNISGGTAPLEYQWSNGANTQDISNLIAGSYSVSVTDANGCEATASATLTQPAFLTSSKTSPTVNGGYHIACNGNSTGSIDLTVSGGTMPYSFQWNNGSATEDLSNIPAGNYALTVTDANGCLSHITSLLTQPNPFVSGASSPAYNGGYNISCSGLSNGSVNLSVSGGTQPYVYSWNTGISVEDLTTVSAGTYSVTVSDANGCLTNSSIILSQPAALAADTDVTKFNGNYNISCYGLSDGSIDLSVFGGTEPYSFLWNTSDSTEDISNLPAGSYTVSVTDANACTVNAIAILTQPDSMDFNLDADTLYGGYHVSGCNGNEGTIDLTVNGGTLPYSFIWSNGINTEDLNNLGAGIYNVIITDDNGCSGSAAVELTQPNSFASSISSPQVNGGYNISCFGNNDGSIDLLVSGAASPYTYLWSNGDPAEDISAIGAGMYSVTVTDLNGCTTIASKILSQPNALSSSFSASVFTGGNNISCNGASDGYLNLTANGGTQPYSYTWNTGQNSEDIFSLQAGTYAVTVTDANGCSTNSSITLIQPQPLVPSASSPMFNGGYNISCNGYSDGSVDLAVNGGTQPYLFSWSTGDATEDINSLEAGAYDLTVTDANACTATEAISLTQPPLLTSGVVSFIYNGGYNISCNGNADGSVDLTVNGGTQPFSYTWNNAASTQDLLSVVAGNYSVTITDANGCIENASVFLTQPDSLAASGSPTIFSGGYNISCNGLADGAIDFSVLGGTAPFSYEWSNGSFSQDIESLVAGNYSVTVVDANDCSIARSLTLTQPAELISQTSADVVNGSYNISCKGYSDGSINLTVSGGTQPYSYLWSNGSLTEDISSLPAGNYSVTVTDANNCTSVSSITLTEPDNLSSATSAAAFNGGYNISCFGLEDGYINQNVNGGTQPFAYLWNNGALTQDISSLPAGNYSVTVTDANGCSASSAIVLSQPDSIQTLVTLTSVNGGYNISCNGINDGAIDITPAGGTQPYIFLWSTGDEVEDINNLAAGAYSVTITDANACTATQSYNLTQPDILQSSATGSTVTGGHNISCYGATDGSINLSVNGGTQPYVFTWSNGASTEDISNLAAGNYSVTVTDANGCIVNSSVMLTQPVPMESDTILSQYGEFNISCYGLSDGAIDLQVSGGTLPYDYSWSNSTTTEDIDSISAGAYSVTVTDANGCLTVESITLTQPDSIVTSLIADTVNGGYNVSGCGIDDGSINLTVNGGAGPYSYLWSNGSADEDPDSIGAGTYNVIITDINGCSASTSIGLTQPNSFAVLSVSPQVGGGYNITCNSVWNGSINLFVSGGVTPYSYLWSNGAVSKDVYGLPAGLYSVTVTDDNGCTSVTSEILTEPAVLSAVSSALQYSGGYNISCNGLYDGSIGLMVNGGTSPYVFEWNNGDTASSLSTLSSGTYIVTVTDANNCTAMDTITLLEPGSIVSELASTNVNGGYNVSCYSYSDGSLNLTVTGGTQPYTYQWSNGANTEDIGNLSAGQYAVTITDANGCNINPGTTLTQPDSITLQTVIPFVNGGYNIACYGMENGFVDLTLIGGTSPYDYIWSNGAITEDLTSVSAGAYSVSVTDANGCISVTTVILTQPDSLTVSSVLSAGPGTYNISCNGMSDGFINLAIAGGTQPHDFLWSNGESTEDLNNLSAGTYSVTVTDANACVVIAAAALTEPVAISFSSVTSSFIGGYNTSCNEKEDGSIDISIAEAVKPLSFIWSNGDSTEDVTGLAGGNYSVTITDGYGCTLNQSFTITVPPPFSESTIAVAYDNITCAGGNNGVINLSVSGGISPYQFTWNNGANSEDLTGLRAGSYTVTVTDTNNCTAEITLDLSQPDSLKSLLLKRDMTCSDIADGYINLNISGGVAPYSFSWDNGQNVQEMENLQAGNYSATVTDINGCSILASTEITDPGNDLCYLDMPNGYSPNNDGKNDFFVINGIEFKRENRLIIYNRWGNEVYQKENYLNEWDGKNSNNEDLPDGTYFCVLVINTENIVLKSFVDIRR